MRPLNGVPIKPERWPVIKAELLRRGYRVIEETVWHPIHGAVKQERWVNVADELAERGPV